MPMQCFSFCFQFIVLVWAVGTMFGHNTTMFLVGAYCAPFVFSIMIAIFVTQEAELQMKTK